MTMTTIHLTPSNRAFRRGLILAAWLCAITPVRAAPSWDIVGLKLGMTEQEALATLKAHSPNAKLITSTRKFSYNDGAKRQETAAFTSGLVAQTSIDAQDNETLQLEFSAPPLEQRLISLRRTLTIYAEPPALAQMIDSLTQKYGAPASEIKYGIGQTDTALAWVEAGRKPCGKTDKGVLVPPVSQATDPLRWYELQKKKNLAPADASQCSAVLQTVLTTRAGGSSVVRMEFQMTDPGHGVPAMQATAKWLADLEAEARSARLKSGKTPKL